MSGSHNPDIIYQMLCRVLRGGPDIQKYYIKVSSKELHNMALTHLSVCAALMLTDKKYLETYNGSNFNEIKIPISKKNTNNGSASGSGSQDRTNKKTNITLLPEFTNDVIDTFRNVIHDLDNEASIYKIVSIREAKSKLGYSRKVITYEDMLLSAAGNMVSYAE